MPPLALVSFTEEEQVGILVLLHQISNLVRSGKTRTNFTVEPAWMSCQPPAIYSIDCQLEEITVLLPVRLPNIEQVEREKLRACCSPPPFAPLPFLYLQRNFSMSVNSAAVLRLTGRGGGPIAGAPRGRSTSRGRGKNSTNIKSEWVCTASHFRYKQLVECLLWKHFFILALLSMQYSQQQTVKLRC